MSRGDDCHDDAGDRINDGQGDAGAVDLEARQIAQDHAQVDDQEDDEKAWA